MKKTATNSIYFILKRSFDLLVSLVGIIALSPLLIIIILILKFSGEGEIFYLQERMGLNKKPFHIYKFATMLKNSPNLGNKTLTVRNDPRITKTGQFLRMTKINELPQIINVIKGDMSLVGPRPLLSKSFEKYAPEVQSVIYKNRPGITGLGSLVFRDEELLVTMYKELGNDPVEYYKTNIFPHKGALEVWYYNNCCVLIDLKILFLTFWSLVNPKSQLVYIILKNLPIKPTSLTVAGLKNL
ncbi:sugar transferase [Flavobacterium sp. 7A]|uniref:sugar transferase n=1 Tax=Flavobacterium sp. 7A TaxID=2940571 RepID=UPI002226E1D8|nr:sugar transferase [Flavobacterium sp. 7A]MCW2120291.1 lipopolysaccharide/colanic/teichoic acid biosynthesis glycosyltransferase [Flavobacterium sp. 7A]